MSVNRKLQRKSPTLTIKVRPGDPDPAGLYNKTVREGNLVSGLHDYRVGFDVPVEGDGLRIPSILDQKAR